MWVLRPQTVSGFVRSYGVVLTGVLLALFYWFVTAPHVRFAYGFLSAESLLLLTADC